jgi:hypothetical protein
LFFDSRKIGSYNIPADPIYDLRDSDFGADKKIKPLNAIPIEEMRVDNVNDVSNRSQERREQEDRDYENQQRIKNLEDRDYENQQRIRNLEDRDYENQQKPDRSERSEDDDSTDKQKYQMINGKITKIPKKVKFSVER